MPFIIDAYNVLHVVGVLPPDLAGIEIDDLVRLIERSRFAQEKVQLVCDGSPAMRSGQVSRGRISVRHSGAGRTADSVIIAAIKASTAPRRLTVVSSDREIRRAARKRRCTVMTSEAFLKRLEADVARANSVSDAPSRATSSRARARLAPREVDRWKAAFGVTDVEVERLSAEVAAAAPSRQASPPAKVRAKPAVNQPRQGRRARQRDDTLDESLRHAIAEAQAMLDSGRPIRARPNRAKPEPSNKPVTASPRRPRASTSRGLRQLDGDQLREMFDEARRLAAEDSAG
jgi:hypothetical protein